SNHPQFKSSLFEAFLENNGVCHRTSAPYHPSTIGQAERFVQTIKKSLKCMQDERGDVNLKLNRLLMQMRKVPNDNGDSPYSLMFGRDIRSRLDMIMKHAGQEDNGDIYSRRGPRRTVEVGTRVQVRRYRGPEKWSFGVITEKQGLLYYIVKMDNGDVWRRHIDQIRRTLYTGGKSCCV
ncbi:hypothetical protein WDU94_012169, partial [Cyamophila willieti]